MISVREYKPCCMSRHSQSNPRRASRATMLGLASAHHTPLLSPPNPGGPCSSAVTRLILAAYSWQCRGRVGRLLPFGHPLSEKWVNPRCSRPAHVATCVTRQESGLTHLANG